MENIQSVDPLSAFTQMLSKDENVSEELKEVFYEEEEEFKNSVWGDDGHEESLLDMTNGI